jgi:hypothetical protein
MGGEDNFGHGAAVFPLGANPDQVVELISPFSSANHPLRNCCGARGNLF